MKPDSDSSKLTSWYSQKRGLVKRMVKMRMTRMASLVRFAVQMILALKGLQTTTHRSIVNSTVSQMLRSLKRYMKGYKTEKVCDTKRTDNSKNLTD